MDNLPPGQIWTGSISLYTRFASGHPLVAQSPESAPTPQFRSKPVINVSISIVSPFLLHLKPYMSLKPFCLLKLICEGCSMNTVHWYLASTCAQAFNLLNEWRRTIWLRWRKHWKSRDYSQFWTVIITDGIGPVMTRPWVSLYMSICHIEMYGIVQPSEILKWCLVAQWSSVGWV